MLQVTGDCSDVWCVEVVAHVVDEFVCGEETEGVGILSECVENGERAVEVCGVVRCPWRHLVDGFVGKRRVDVENHVDTGLVEDGCAFVVVLEKGLVSSN